MANPNLVNVTSIVGNTEVSALTTTTGNIVTNSAASNTVVKLNLVSVSNYSNAAITSNVMMNRSSTNYYLVGSVSVPANSTLVVISKDQSLYMLEGDVLQANVSANSSASMIASFETLA